MLPVRPIASYLAKLSFAILVVLWLQGPLSAGLRHPLCHRKASCEIRNCEFFGYYPTCWQRWPAGWQGCPTPGVELAPLSPAPATGESPELETLPPPKPAASAPTKAPDAVDVSASPYHRLLPIAGR